MLTQPDDGANAYRELLFAQRYVDPKRKDGYIDRFLFLCVSFIQIYRSSGIFKGSGRKEIAKTWKEQHFDDSTGFGEAGERALYWELRNASARYFKTCQSPSYGRALFGLIQSKEGNRQRKMCQDAWEMSAGMAQRLEREQELKIWTDAVYHSYLAAEPDGERLWAELEAKKQGRN